MKLSLYQQVIQGARPHPIPGLDVVLAASADEAVKECGWEDASTISDGALRGMLPRQVVRLSHSASQRFPGVEFRGKTVVWWLRTLDEEEKGDRAFLRSGEVAVYNATVREGAVRLELPVCLGVVEGETLEVSVRRASKGGRA